MNVSAGKCRGLRHLADAAGPRVEPADARFRHVYPGFGA